MSVKQHASNELMQDLADIVEGVFLQFVENIDPNTAKMLGIEASMQLASEWGGRNIYIPQGMKCNVQSRDEQVYEMFTGKNFDEICSYFGISEQWAYKIIKRQREKLRNKIG